jgi:hypothetical protein
MDNVNASQRLVWEYQTLEVQSTRIDMLHFQANALGSLGWEVCGLAGVDKTIGFNAMAVLMKRPGLGLAPPEDRAAGWREDPSGRFQQRHWDGCRWTEHVIGTAGPTTDFPTVERLVPPRN